MSITGEQTDIGSGSFWEVGQYKRTLKRIEDGNRLCNDLMSLVQERGEIEKTYSKSLRHWSKKWNDLISKGPEYGTTEAAWKSVLNEADRVAHLHTNIREELMSDVHADVKSWQKQSFHKPMMGPLKEIKDMEDAYKKAQKPWAKKLDRVTKCKKDYHLACRSEKTARNQENNAKGDSSISDDQRKKLEEKVQKLGNDVVNTRDRYQAALQDINAYNAKYMEDMSEVFDQCQESERKRLKFIKHTFHNIHRCLDLSAASEFPEIFSDFLHTIENADDAKDLKWWSNVHGADMPMNWPSFEEWSPELTSISKKQGKKDVLNSDGGITLTGIIHQRGESNVSDNSTPAYDTQVSATSNTSVPATVAPPVATVPTTNSIEDRPVVEPTNEAEVETNPFGNEWDDQDGDALVDDGSPGVPVRALYDYDGAEDDELTFKAGDMLDKLEDEDEQGWCKGRANGRVGLYPVSYCEPV